MVMDEQNQRMARARIRESALFEMFAFSAMLVMSVVADPGFAQVGVTLALGISLHRYRLSSRGMR